MSDKKKVLITIDWFDPAYKAGGPVISTIKLIENLHDIYDFRIITGAVDYGDTEPFPGILTDQWVDWRGMARVYYVSEAGKSRSKIFQLLDDEVADIYYVQGIFSKYFSIYPLIWWHQAKQDKIIVAPRGMLHSTALGVKRLKKSVYLMSAKIMGWFHHVHFHTTNCEETAEIKKTLGKDVLYHEASNFPHVLPFQKENPMREKGNLKLLSIARISPEKNTRFLIDSLAEVKENVTLTMVGNYQDEAYFRSVMKRIEKLPPNITVNYVGHKKVSELSEFYAANDVMILPTLGENFGHAIAEALYSGLPCLISHNTPWSQLEENGAGFNLDLQEKSFASKVDEISKMSDTDFADMCKNARKYVDAKINIEAIREKYKEMLS